MLQAWCHFGAETHRQWISALTSDKESFDFSNPHRHSGDQTPAEHVHPWAVGCVFKAVKACVVPSPGPRMSPNRTLQKFVFLWANRAFPYNHGAVVWTVKVHCVVSYWKASVAAYVVMGPTMPWLGFVFEIQFVTGGRNCQKTELERQKKWTQTPFVHRHVSVSSWI